MQAGFRSRTMQQMNKWTATSNPSEPTDGEELVDIADKWGTGIDVKITKPFEYKKGPIITTIHPQQIPDPSPTTL
jgi:hypothetical protein